MLIPLVLGGLAIAGILIAGSAKAPAPETSVPPTPVKTSARIRALQAVLDNLRPAYEAAKREFEKRGVRMAFSTAGVGKRMFDEIRRLEAEILALGGTPR